ncbi:MAG: hypothetical protein KA314_11915 [Chloroflexi bacterium]|nr:hypothetical protein [Chloroflexota bacterium]MBP8056540.1 hypothetical protein [Chloroflexota bacterium]
MRFGCEGGRRTGWWWGWGVVMLLIGCQVSPTNAPIPTLLAAASLPADVTPILPPPTSQTLSGVPATFTPLPPSSPDSATSGQAIPLAPTNIPTPTPLLPSRTPSPTPTATTAVLTPTLEATPYVAFMPTLPPTDELGPSKLSIHVIRNNDPAIMEFVRRAHPAVIKAVDDIGFLEEVKEVSPWTVTVARLNGPEHYGGDPEQAARDYVARFLNQYLANPYVDYWEGWNEPDPNLENMYWYSQFEQERTREMARYGLKVAIGGFSTGVPEIDEFTYFIGAIEVAMAHGGILTLHEYGAPDMTFLFGSQLPGGYPRREDAGALTFRYRYFYRDILEPLGLAIPLVISEAGVDGIIGNRPGPDGLGWADFQDFWVNQGWGIDGPSAFINQLAWYDAGVRQDGYVIGFTIFTAGAIGHWENYNINPILPQLADYVISQQ